MRRRTPADVRQLIAAVSVVGSPRAKYEALRSRKTSIALCGARNSSFRKSASRSILFAPPTPEKRSPNLTRTPCAGRSPVFSSDEEEQPAVEDDVEDHVGVATLVHPASLRGQSSDVLTISTRPPRRSFEGVPSFLVETYLARGDAQGRAARERQARSAAEELTRQGTRVRFDRAIHVPEDEICFFVFDAPSSLEAVLLAERAGLDHFRVVEAIPSGEEYRS